jgi:hypothetical protein
VTAAILDANSTALPTLSVEESLAACREELARLRSSIILTAKWEALSSEDSLRRRDLHADLLKLRALYFEKIDAIAMTYGVQQAMDIKEEVEHSVSVPRM